MDYEQKNPIPVPETGAYQKVKGTIESVFDWRYALEQKKLLGLYEKGKNLSWNASELDWSTDVDIERMSVETDSATFINEVLKPPRRLDEKEAITYRVHSNAFLLSQFLHGEQGALMAAAKIVQTVPNEEAKFYAANQVADEARHVEVYHRYLTEKLGLSYEVHPSLKQLLDDILTDERWDITYLGMQIMVEGLALAAFGLLRMTTQSEPLIQEITKRIMADEARHVAFGVLSLQGLYTEQMSSQEIKDREGFVIEATKLLHDRLLATPVFERLGWDDPAWIEWQRDNPMNIGFRQMMFTKIVPNLRRLGLLTPEVRKAFQDLDLLRYEHMKDSVEEPDVTPPAELVQMLMERLQPSGGSETPAS